MIITLMAINGTLNKVLIAPIKLINRVFIVWLSFWLTPVINCWYCSPLGPLFWVLHPILLRKRSSLNTAIPLTLSIIIYSNFPNPNILSIQLLVVLWLFHFFDLFSLWEFLQIETNCSFVPERFAGCRDLQVGSCLLFIQKGLMLKNRFNNYFFTYFISW